MYTKTRVRSLPKGLIWIETDTQISPAEHSLGQKNDIAAICDIRLLEQQAFPPHGTPCKNLSHSTLCSCCFLVVTLNRGGQYRICTQQPQLHRNSSSFPGKTCSKTSLTCFKKTPWQLATASKEGYWLLSSVALLPNCRLTTGFSAFRSKGKHLC